MRCDQAFGRLLVVMALAAPTAIPVHAQLETRTPTGGSNITTRECIGGSDAGEMCKEDSECDSGNCFDFNLIDLTVNFRDAAGAAWFTTIVQLGFVAGTAVAAVLNLADVIPARRYFAVSAVLAAGSNALILLGVPFLAGLGSRFCTGCR